MLPLHQWLILHPHGGSDESAPGSSALKSEWLFNASTEPVMIVDVATEIIVDANPPALSLLRAARADLLGKKFQSAFLQASHETICNSLAATHSGGQADAIFVRALNGGTELSLRLSLVNAPPKSYALVRLEPQACTAFRSQGGAMSVVFQALDNSSVGFLITDGNFCVDYANRAFIEMAEAGSPAEVRGSALVRWLKLSAEDLSGLREQLSERRAATLLAATMHSSRNCPTPVEVCAVAVPDGPNSCWGFSVRKLVRLN
jgi:PAS domain-containing protein